MKRLYLVFALVASILLSSTHTIASAERNIQFTHVIRSGALTATMQNINEGFNPSFKKVECNKVIKQIHIGSDRQRLYVENPKGTNDGWTLSVFADPHNAQSMSPTVTSRACNDANGNPNVIAYANGMSVKPDCLRCTPNDIIQSMSEFDFSQNNTNTLLKAPQSKDGTGRWYVTGLAVEQTYQDTVSSSPPNLKLVMTMAAS